MQYFKRSVLYAHEVCRKANNTQGTSQISIPCISQLQQNPATEPNSSVNHSQCQPSHPTSSQKKQPDPSHPAEQQQHWRCRRRRLEPGQRNLPSSCPCLPGPLRLVSICRHGGKCEPLIDSPGWIGSWKHPLGTSCCLCQT